METGCEILTYHSERTLGVIGRISRISTPQVLGTLLKLVIQERLANKTRGTRTSSRGMLGDLLKVERILILSGVGSGVS